MVLVLELGSQAPALSLGPPAAGFVLWACALRPGLGGAGTGGEGSSTGLLPPSSPPLSAAPWLWPGLEAEALVLVPPLPRARHDLWSLCLLREGKGVDAFVLGFPKWQENV